ncbi:MAG: Cupin type-1 protein, partial [Chloroflexi bacterium]|nr:Cupin type-1 protein [Chloroflexota bacterium]
LRMGSQKFGVHFHDIGSREGVLRSTREGGTLIEFEDEDPEVRRTYLDEIAKNGVEFQMAAR